MSVTVNEIAEKCGVSRTTVLRALNNQSRVSDATRKKILETAKELGYRPNLLARSFNTGRTMMIGMVAINMDNMHTKGYLDLAIIPSSRMITGMT